MSVFHFISYSDASTVIIMFPALRILSSASKFANPLRGFDFVPQIQKLLISQVLKVNRKRKRPSDHKKPTKQVNETQITMNKMSILNPLTMGLLLAAFVGQTTAFSGTALSSRTTTRLAYRDLAQTELSATVVENKQAVVDDYLEFLERRYNRLNENESQQRNESTFSAWKWLMQGSEAEETVHDSQQSRTDSALHVLGLADLASKKLLQKHNKASPDVIDVSSLPVTGVGAVVKPIAIQRKRLLSFQTAKVRALAKVLLKTLKKGPAKAVKSIVSIGGGEKTIAVTLTAVCAAAFLVARPLAQTILTEGAHHA